MHSLLFVIFPFPSRSEELECYNSKTFREGSKYKVCLLCMQIATFVLVCKCFGSAGLWQLVPKCNVRVNGDLWHLKANPTSKYISWVTLVVLFRHRVMSQIPGLSYPVMWPACAVYARSTRKDLCNYCCIAINRFSREVKGSTDNLWNHSRHTHKKKQNKTNISND